MLDRIGQGTVYCDIQEFTPGGADILVPPGNITLATNSFYGVKTSLGAYTLTLPLLSNQAPPAFLEVGDIDNNAGINHITILTTGADVISDHGVTGSTYTIVISNIIVRFIANTTYWTAIPFGS